MGENIKAHEWRWTISDAQMQPKYTDIGYEPDELLSQIYCKCKTNCLTSRSSHAESTDLFVPLPVVNAME